MPDPDPHTVLASRLAAAEALIEALRSRLEVQDDALARIESWAARFLEPVEDAAIPSATTMRMAMNGIRRTAREARRSGGGGA